MKKLINKSLIFVSINYRLLSIDYLKIFEKKIKLTKRAKKQKASAVNNESQLIF